MAMLPCRRGSGQRPEDAGAWAEPRAFTPYVGGVGAHRAGCEQVARDGYRGPSRSLAEARLAMDALTI